MTAQADLQEAVFAFLADPATHAGRPVRRIDTHAASVFLAGERAYKVKRAVRFPFLDYSDLDKRKAACLAELTVNRPFAADLYLGVVPITRAADGRLTLGGDGEPVEWAVEMVRFDENQTLDHVAEARGLDDILTEALAERVAVMHRTAPAADAEAWIAALGRYIAQNSEAFAADAALFAAADARELESRSRAALEKLRPLLVERGRQGLVRRAHGDLHLGNIALIGGKPAPFDAIEFDPVIASGDVLYDLAFLLMDLVERRLDRAANIVFNRYFLTSDRPDDVHALGALPLFMSLRAAIRAKATAARLPHADAAKRPAIAGEAQSYFRLALALLSPPRPVLIAVGGLSGTGKSVLARALAPSVLPAPGALIVRSDVMRKHLAGKAETERLPRDAYTPAASATVYLAVCARANATLAAGHSAVVDAVYATEEERADIAAVAAAAGAPFHGLFLHADIEARMSRVGSRTGDASDADADVVRQQEKLILGSLDWTAVDAAGTPAETLERARRAVAATIEGKS
ncbi:MAG: AAA family ATPase [Pseudorhodoplanes sp.]